MTPGRDIDNDSNTLSADEGVLGRHSSLLVPCRRCLRSRLLQQHCQASSAPSSVLQERSQSTLKVNTLLAAGNQMPTLPATIPALKFLRAPATVVYDSHTPDHAK
jgi:hypothetical protein